MPPRDQSESWALDSRFVTRAWESHGAHFEAHKFPGRSLRRGSGQSCTVTLLAREGGYVKYSVGMSDKYIGLATVYVQVALTWWAELQLQFSQAKYNTGQINQPALSTAAPGISHSPLH